MLLLSIQYWIPLGGVIYKAGFPLLHEEAGEDSATRLNKEMLAAQSGKRCPERVDQVTKLTTFTAYNHEILWLSLKSLQCIHHSQFSFQKTKQKTELYQISSGHHHLLPASGLAPVSSQMSPCKSDPFKSESDQVTSPIPQGFKCVQKFLIDFHINLTSNRQTNRILQDQVHLSPLSLTNHIPR